MEDIYLFWFYLFITKKNKELGNIWKYLLYILRKHTLQILYNRDTCDLYKRELITAIHNEKSKLELNKKNTSKLNCCACSRLKELPDTPVFEINSIRLKESLHWIMLRYAFQQKCFVN